MKRLSNIGAAGSQMAAAKTMHAAQAQRTTMEQLLEEQRRTNALLWALLTPEQKATLTRD